MSYFSDNQKQFSERSLAEWVSFSASLLLLMLLVSLVLYKWVTKKNQPPIISVTIDSELRQSQGQFYVPFTVSNDGGEAVESVEVKAQIELNGEIEEIGSQQIDFLSDGETQSGAFILDRDPRQGKMIVRVTGYKLP